MSEYIVDLTTFTPARQNGKQPIVSEEIVRCRDCKFCMAYMAGTYCDYMAHSVELDGFCAWGARADA